MNRFCGFTPLTAGGDAPLTSSGISGLSNPVLYGNRLYAFNYANTGAAPTGDEDKMLCFDVSTDQACPGQPYAVKTGLGDVSVGGFPTPPIALIGHQLTVPIGDLDGNRVLACLDASTEGSCSGSSWPLSLSSTNYFVDDQGPPFPKLDASGNVVGFCLPDSTDECFGLDGSSTSTPAGMASAIGSSASWNGEALVLGPRVYVPAFFNVVYCYDASTNASCANFPKALNGLGNLYTVNPDPQRPTCIWVNSDGGSAQIQNFDAFTGGPCGEGAVRVLASQFLVAGSKCAATSYVSLQIVSPTPNQYKGGSVHFEDGDGSPIPGVSDQPIDSSGLIKLTGLSLNTPTGPPQFLITLKGTSGNPGAVVLKLAWKAPYDVSCLDDDAFAGNPAPSLLSISAAIRPATAIAWYQGMLHGAIISNGGATTWHFEYGPTTKYGLETTSQSISGRHGLVLVSFPVSNLARGTVYHYRIVAVSSLGKIATSGDATFRTPSPSIRLEPGSVIAGKTVHVLGDTGGCPAGEVVMLVSRAFSHKHKFLGEGAIFVVTDLHGHFSATTKIPKRRVAGRYTVNGRCGAGPWWFAGFPATADVALGRAHAATDAEGRRLANPLPHAKILTIAR